MPLRKGTLLEVEVADVATGTVEVLKSRYVIWAAGEFQYPRSSSGPLFSGSQHCLHNSAVASWKDLEGDDFVVIGGYESGMDAASNLAVAFEPVIDGDFTKLVDEPLRIITLTDETLFEVVNSFGFFNGFFSFFTCMNFAVYIYHFHCF